MGDTELLPDTASLTALVASDFPMVLSDTVLPTALSDTVLAMLWPMPHPWSMPPLLSTMLSTLPLLPTMLSAMLPPTLLRSPPTPTTTEWLMSTLARPLARVSLTMALGLLRAPTR